MFNGPHKVAKLQADEIRLIRLAKLQQKLFWSLLQSAAFSFELRRNQAAAAAGLRIESQFDAWAAFP